jgi:hypothetical protein
MMWRLLAHHSFPRHSTRWIWRAVCAFASVAVTFEREMFEPPLCTDKGFG